MKPVLLFFALTVFAFNSSFSQGSRLSSKHSSCVANNITTVSYLQPLDEHSFCLLYGRIKNLTFDSDRLNESKCAVTRGGFSAQQVKMLMELMHFESSRLEFAKYAYAYVCDRGVYAIVKEAFTFSLSGDELDNYIRRSDVKTQNLRLTTLD